MQIKLHDELNPDLWVGDRLKPDVRKHLLTISKDFINTLKIHQNPEDITITGSSANYNYTESSDIDLHILLDFKTVECDEEMTRDYVLAKKSLWNDKHDITIFGREVEVYVQDTNESHTSTGVFSLLRNVWIEHPEWVEAPDIDQHIFDKKLKEYVDIIEHNISRDTNHKLLSKIRKNISDMRKQGLARIGQYSIENLVFKELRNRGYLDKLAGYETAAYDRSVSMESFANFFKKKR